MSKLRLLLGVFFLSLALPTGVLIYRASSQLKWESFHQHRVLAEEFAGRIDAALNEMLSIEEARSFGDFAFLVAAGDLTVNYVQRSPLSTLPMATHVPGLVGYFQIDPDGRFSTPLLPVGDPGVYGVSSIEYRTRVALEQKILTVLADNRLLEGKPLPAPFASLTSTRSEKISQTGHAQDEVAGVAPTAKPELRVPPSEDAGVPSTSTSAFVESQAAFDTLKSSLSPASQRGLQQLERVDDLKLDTRLDAQSRQQTLVQENASAPVENRAVRKERNLVPNIVTSPVREAGRPSQGVRVTAFESELDPFEFSLLDSGHFVLFRNAWHDGGRYIQGALIEQKPFLRGAIGSVFTTTALSQMSALLVAWRGGVVDTFGQETASNDTASTNEWLGTLLYRGRLTAPLSYMELILSLRQLPAAPGAHIVWYLAAVVGAVLCMGCYLLYRLGLGQIRLARQQQDFVSAVSHELKTPLTSIRMYGEMLREGWVDEIKKKTYYDYIYEESERLSRLITNVLQLARMTRSELQLNIRTVRVGELMDMLHSKVVTQAERAGFKVSLAYDSPSAMLNVAVDVDAFAQVVINLVDNALKFSAASECKIIEISAGTQRDAQILFAVRDHGPGVARHQMKKIFELFYRATNELTRDTVGTGIGLALVHQLVVAMGGQVDVRNRQPGAEFRLLFPVSKSANLVPGDLGRDGTTPFTEKLGSEVVVDVKDQNTE